MVEHISDKRDIIEDLELIGYIKMLRLSGGNYGITRVTIDGKYFVEEYLKTNDTSNTKLIGEAIESSSKFNSINIQLRTAKRYLESIDSSDYRNAVKEAIGAVESTLRLALNDQKLTVGEGLKKLNKEYGLHPAFSRGLSNLYGFNSDSGGIRHGLNEGEFEPNYTDAKFMILTYSAFVNYIIEKHNL